ncbi:MAG: APC family permease [Gemmatimonadetes bacterium]|nr:APC family permease [Gemmatimonadota bacterium]
MPLWAPRGEERFSPTVVDRRSPLTATAEPHRSDRPSHQLGLGDLTFFALTCVFSARWLPIAANAGPGSITLWVLAVLFFAAPLTVAVAALVAKYPGTGGIYRWTREDFGSWHGFFAGWTYWIGIATLFPTAAMLYARVGFALLPDGLSELGADRRYFLLATLGLIWVALGANLVGLHIGKWAESLGAIASAVVGLMIMIAAWLIWQRRGSATPMEFWPTWDWKTIGFFASIAYATSGMEGPGAMASAARDPERTMRRAGWIATALAAALYLGGTVAFLVILPPDRVTGLTGFVEVAKATVAELGFGWFAPVLAGLVVFSGIGFLGGIGTATSQLPLAAGADGLLPAAVGRPHPTWGTPYLAITALGGVATLLLLAFQLGDTVQAAFDALVSVMVITGFAPYLYLFASAWKAGRRLSATFGFGVTSLAIAAAVVPPPGIGNVLVFEAKLIVGTLGTALGAWLVYRRFSRR